MKNPLVSVIIATYRRDVALINALNSLADQTYDNFEILLIDDNDDPFWNDKISKIASDFAAAKTRPVRLFVNHPNMGSARARNRGINEALGEYIVFLDDDDLYLPGRIEKQLKFVEEANADYSLSDLELYNDDDTLNEFRMRDYLLTDESENLCKCHLKYHMTGTDTMMFRTEYLRSIGGFDPIDVGDEYYLMMKAINASGKFVYSPVNEVKAYVHTGEGGLSSGQGKINGENRLFEFKKQYFGELKSKDRRYIVMRHYAVLAYAYLRIKLYGSFLKCSVKSFFSSPVQCIHLFFERKKAADCKMKLQ